VWSTEELHALLQSPTHTLRKLDISDTSCSNLTFTSLAKPTCALTHLNLANTSLSFSNLMRITNNLAPTLTNLDIRQCPFLDSPATLLNHLMDPSNLPNLSSLSLSLYFLHEEFIESTVTAITATDLLPPDDVWACRHCTLFNEDSATRCAACNVRKVSVDEERRQQQRAPAFSEAPTRPLFVLPPVPVSSKLTSLFIELKIDDEKSRVSQTKLFQAKTDSCSSDPILSSPPRRKQQSATPCPSSGWPQADHHSPALVSAAATSFLCQLAASLPASLVDLSVDFLASKDEDDEELQQVRKQSKSFAHC